MYFEKKSHSIWWIPTSIHEFPLNTFVSDTPFLQPLKTLQFSDVCHGVEKGCIENKCFKKNLTLTPNIWIKLKLGNVITVDEQHILSIVNHEKKAHWRSHKWTCFVVSRQLWRKQQENYSGNIKMSNIRQFK